MQQAFFLSERNSLFITMNPTLYYELCENEIKNKHTHPQENSK